MIEIEPELSRPLQVDKIGAGGVEEHIVASAKERAALAQRFGLLDLSRLEAKIDVDHEEGRMLSVTGKVFADVVQPCVVTLEPVPAQVSETIRVLFAPPHLIKDAHEGGLGDVEAEDPPEPIENGVIDLGELVAQHLATALDPYPRKPGACLNLSEAAPPRGGAGAGREAQSPFAELSKLVNKPEEG